MSRSGYSEDCDGWDLIRWRGAVASAIRGRRGQAFLREMEEALEAIPDKRLISGELVSSDGECCAMGAVAMKRQMDVSDVDPEDRDAVAALFGIAPAMAAEIAFRNDEFDRVRGKTYHLPEDHDPTDRGSAIHHAQQEEGVPLGLIYREDPPPACIPARGSEPSIGRPEPEWPQLLDQFRA